MCPLFSNPTATVKEKKKNHQKNQWAECLFTQGRFPRDSPQHLQLPSETSLFHQHVLPHSGCAGRRRTPRSTVSPNTTTVGRAHTKQAPQKHPFDLCSHKTKPLASTESSLSSKAKALVIRLVCHTQTLLLCQALPGDNFQGELKQMLAHIYFPQIPKGTRMVREEICRRAKTQGVTVSLFFLGIHLTEEGRNRNTEVTCSVANAGFVHFPGNCLGISCSH